MSWWFITLIVVAVMFGTWMFVSLVFGLAIGAACGVALEHVKDQPDAAGERQQESK
jgi:hypothetical protein